MDAFFPSQKRSRIDFTCKTAQIRWGLVSNSRKKKDSLRITTHVNSCTEKIKI